MRVLIGAYACEPAQGSEPAVGWNWAREAVRAGHEVWVITRCNNRGPIEDAIRVDDSDMPHFEYVDLPRPLLWGKRKFGHAGLLAYYYLWQAALSVRARRLHVRIGFDIAHHVTFVNDSLPSGLCVLRVPFVWGPVGGSTHILPSTVQLNLPPYARAHETVRRGVQGMLRRLDPFLALTRRRASVILVYTQEAREGLSEDERRRAHKVVHIGISKDEYAHRPPVRARSPRETLRVLSGGRLVHWKGFDLLIEGFGLFVRSNPHLSGRLIFTGTGSYLPTLRDLVQREGLSGVVEFVGRLPSTDDVNALLGQSDVFALPTLRDGPPVALLEAMAFGLPTLCLDIGAPAELVPDFAGIKIQPRSREFIVAEIAAALAWLAENPEDARAMGDAARAYALQRHDWAHVRHEIESAYAVAVRTGQ